MGRNSLAYRDKELRVEKLFLRKGLVDKLDLGELLGLEDFASFIWHNHPNYVSKIMVDFLSELIACHREGRAYTQDDWVRLSKVMDRSKSSRDIVFYKLLHLGLIEKHNKTKMRYEIRLSDKFLRYLELIAQSWIMVCENESKVK